MALHASTWSSRLKYILRKYIGQNAFHNSTAPGGVLHGILHLQGNAMSSHCLHLHRGAQEEVLRTGWLGGPSTRLDPLLASLDQDEEGREGCA